MFSKKHFPKISHLLNTPNQSRETSLDFAFNDAVAKLPPHNHNIADIDSRIVDLFLDHGAVSLRNPSLSGYMEVYERRKKRMKKKRREKETDRKAKRHSPIHHDATKTIDRLIQTHRGAKRHSPIHPL